MHFSKYNHACVNSLSFLVGFGGWYPYIKIDKITKVAPTINCNDSWNPKSKTETKQVIIIAREQANPFRMLSAYLITTATKSPPVAFKTTKYHIKRSYPKKNPFSLISLPCLKKTATVKRKKNILV